MVTSDGERVRNAAAQYVARMDSDNWSDADEAGLQAWLAEDPMRQGLLLQMQAQWLALAPADATRGEETPDGAAAADCAPPSRWARRGVLGGLAASTALIFTVVRWNQEPAEYATRQGEIRRLQIGRAHV